MTNAPTATNPARTRILVVVLLLLSSILIAFPRPARAASTPKATVPSRPSGTLIVYESSKEFPVAAESAAIMTANLVGHFDRWTAVDANAYTSGMARKHRAVIYVGSMFRSNPLPAAFVQDITATAQPVLWMGNNIANLSTHLENNRSSLDSRFGFRVPAQPSSTQAFTKVTYKGIALTRAAGTFNVPVMRIARTTAQVLATASDGAGTTTPWAVRSKNFTYISETPFAYNDESDRYLAFADLLFDLYGVNTKRQRAIIRFEDVDPLADPATIRRVTDIMKARNIPFGIHIIPFHVNPDLDGNGRKASRTGISERPDVVDALQYALANGGELIMHGSTHQAGNFANPYNGATGDDFEFFQAHVDEKNNVVFDGGLPGMDRAEVDRRLNEGAAEIARAGLPKPRVWTTPHYAGTTPLYDALKARGMARLERGLYFPGGLTKTTRTYKDSFGQYFPYAVRDIYGGIVLPENIGNPTSAYNQHAARGAKQIVENANAARVVRDGFASSFFHPFLTRTPEGVKELETIVDGVRSLGYTYVSPSAALAEFTTSTNAASTANATLVSTASKRKTV